MRQPNNKPIVCDRSRSAYAACISILIAAAITANSVPAADFKLGNEVEMKVNATATVGTGIRTEEPSPANYGRLSGARVGRSDGLAGDNSGGPDLNFERGRAYTTVLKGFADFDLHYKNLGAFTRLKAWHDYELANGDRPYGNFPNGYAQGVPLSDNGFAREAQFSGIQFTDAYVYGKFNLKAQNTLDARLGRQVVNWGTAQFVTGGIDVINPMDYAAFQRPGAVTEETKLPVGMLYADFSQDGPWGIDGFVQYEFRHDVLNGCGTYLNVATYAPVGCLQANALPNVSEATTFVNNLYVHRVEDVDARDSGQYGVSLRYATAEKRTELRAYAINYHSRRFAVRGTNADIGGGFGNILTRLSDPNGVKYAMLYPEDIHLFGLSFSTKSGRATRFFGEVAYRPNQPLSLNFADLADAFVARNANAILNQPASGKNALALPPGATFDAYDRFKVTTASIGINQGLPGILGAQFIVLAGEVGWSYVNDLPDPSVLRYGRAETYGVAAIPGVPCVDAYPGKTCAYDGFITSSSWGYRALAKMTYKDAFMGASIIPSVLFMHDVDGYSYDGTFYEGRKLLRPAIRAEWGKNYFAEIQYYRVSDQALYSMLIDRDSVVLFAGASF